MAAVQVAMLMVMLVQGIYIFNMKELRKLIGSPFKCPDNLLDVGLVWSAFDLIDRISRLQMMDNWAPSFVLEQDQRLYQELKLLKEDLDQEQVEDSP